MSEAFVAAIILVGIGIMLRIIRLQAAFLIIGFLCLFFSNNPCLLLKEK